MVRIQEEEYEGTGAGSGCGSVGRAVASNSRGPWLESRLRQNFILNILLSTV